MNKNNIVKLLSINTLPKDQTLSLDHFLNKRSLLAFLKPMEALSLDGDKKVSNPKLQRALLPGLEKDILPALYTQLLSITWKILSVADLQVYYFPLK